MQYDSKVYPNQGGLQHPSMQGVTVVQSPQPASYGKPVTRAHSLHHHNNPRYRCCCGSCCHVTTCVYIIGTLELIGILAALISTITEYQQTSNLVDPTVHAYYRNAMIGGIVSFILGLLVIIALFVGVCKEMPTLLIPHILFQILSLIGFLSGIVWYGIGISYVGTDTFKEYAHEAAVGFAIAIIVVFMVLFLIAMAFQIGFLVQVVKCYQYLREKRRGH